MILSGVHEKVRTELERAGLCALVGEENVCDHIHKALARAEAVAQELGVAKSDGATA